MYYNLLRNQKHYNKFINFGSGAELLMKDTPYGLSKHIIRESIKLKPNYYNLRIFGVFDENELNTRFIKANIKRYINKQPIEIYQNKFMDFFYMKDLVSLVKFYIFNNNLKKEINCTYSETLTLLDIANYINTLSDYKVEIPNLVKDKIKEIQNGKIDAYQKMNAHANKFDNLNDFDFSQNYMPIQAAQSPLATPGGGGAKQPGGVVNFGDLKK